MPIKDNLGPTFRMSYTDYYLNKTTGFSSVTPSGPLWPWTKWATSKFWNRTPNFAQLRKEGNLPVQSFHFGKTSCDLVETIRSDWDSPTEHYTRISERRPLIPPPSPDPNLPLPVLNRLRNSLISKAKGNQWNVPVFVAEARKSSVMVAKRAHDLVDMMVAVKRGNLSYFFDKLRSKPSSRHQRALTRDFNKNYGKNTSKAVSNLWLEVTYGWTPLMMDVRNAVNTCMDAVDRPSSRRGRIFTTVSSRTTETRQNVVFEVSPALVGEVIDQVAYSGRATWYFDIDSSDLPASFGLVNPLEVAWELTTLSFVVDWFIPIGDYLRALDVPSRFKHHSGAYGSRVKAISLATAVDNPQPPWTTKSTGSTIVQTGHSTRNSMTDIPTQKLTDLRFDPNVGVSRAISAISLLRQRFR